MSNLAHAIAALSLTPIVAAIICTYGDADIVGVLFLVYFAQIFSAWVGGED